MNTRIRRYPGNRRGMAILVVLIVLGLMSFLSVSNSKTLAALKQDLRRIESRHLYRPVAPVTNPPPMVVSPP
jgi:hypothetical protein